MVRTPEDTTLWSLLTSGTPIWTAVAAMLRSGILGPSARGTAASARFTPCDHRAERRNGAHVMLTLLAADCALYIEPAAELAKPRYAPHEKLKTSRAVEQPSKSPGA